jgi:diguanylate cyclase (GGDEF)-like protein/PAS domain S-box-containing protein
VLEAEPADGDQEDNGEPGHRPDIPERQRLSLAFPLLVFVFLALAISMVGVAGYVLYKRHLTHSVLQDLQSITDFKRGQFTEWLGERRKDAEALTHDPRFRYEFEHRHTPGNSSVDHRRYLHEHLATVRETYGYEDILLYDSTPTRVMSTNPEALPPTTFGMNLIEGALRTGHTDHSDLHYLEADGGEHVRIGVVAPILSSKTGSRAVIGVALLRSDPSRRIFPLIESWPLPTRTGETFLAKVEGGTIVYLTELRHRGKDGVARRFPVTDKSLFAAQVARGREGVMEGTDYRGKEGLGAARIVPGTSWLIVSKIDKDEVYAPLHRTAWIGGAVTLLFILGAGVATLLWWRNQHSAMLARLYRTRLLHKSSRQRLASIARQANDIILLSDSDSIILEVNDRAVEVYGYPAAELRGKHTSVLRAPEAVADYDRDARRWTTEGVVYTTVHQHRDGRAIPVEVSARVIEIDGRQYRQAIIRDITERVSAESRLRESENHLRSIFDNTTTGIASTDLDGRVISFNEAFRAMLGYDARRLSTMNFADFTHPEDLRQETILIAELLAGQRRTYQIEKRYITMDGRKLWVNLSVAAVGNPQGAIERLVAVVTDISARREASEQLRLFASAFEHSNEGIFISDAENRILAANPAFSRMTGYSFEDFRGRNPSMFASGQTDRSTYHELWNSLGTKGYWQGEILDRRKDGSLYPAWISISAVRDTSGKPSHYIASFTDISERKAAEAHIAHLAHHDTLTGLFNRFSLQSRLDQALARAKRERRDLAVMFIDLDHFKNINDTQGHAVGDTVLVEVARRLCNSVRDSDIVARLGGDEFVVVLTEVEGANGSARVAEKILRQLRQPYISAGDPLHASPSIGIAIFPNDGDDSETLMKNADAAMYHAKAKGRNNVQFFAFEMSHATLERLSVEHALHIALEEGQFELHYQPQLDSVTGRVRGVEALVRWRHPKDGLVSPVKFIGIAEDTGLIVPLGAWVLDRACWQIRQWRNQGVADVIMAVNLSAHQLRSPTLVETVSEALKRYDLHGRDLELEITESAAMDDPESSIDKLGALRSLGVRLAIDDFGTGYSSLAYLRRLPIHSLKLDRSFVADIGSDGNDAVICSATIALAHNMGLQIVAEGVETPAQFDFLVAHRCDLLQGYLFSRPVPAATALDFILQRTTDRQKLPDDGQYFQMPRLAGPA